jgi:hypothetical protein
MKGRARTAFRWTRRWVIGPVWRRVLRPLLRLVVFHLIFFIPIPLPELKRGTKEAAELDEELQRANASIATLDDDSLEGLVSLLDEELRTVRSSISEARSRAAQLLGVTGVIAVLAGLGSTSQTSVQLVPTKGAAQVLTLVFAGLAGYALLGTLWLTVQTLAVRSWEELKAEPVAQATSRRIREAHASQALAVRRKLTIRLSRPVGYLRDAYWFFFLTVVLIGVIVGIRIAATAIA